MKKVSNMFREFSMKHIDGYSKLPLWQKDLFDATYKKHLSVMQEKERIKYTENCIKKIEGEISAVKVYFDNGDYYIYLLENRWEKVA